MGSGVFYPAIGADDGSWYGTAYFTPDGDYLEFGKSAAGSVLDMFVRFPNVTIPPGVTVTSAFLRFTAYQNDTSDAIGECYFVLDANPAAPTTKEQAQALVLTANYVTYPRTDWVDGTQYDTADLSAPLQEVIDLSGWLSGNAVLFTMQGSWSSSTNCQRLASSIEYVAGAEKAELHLEWEAQTADEDVCTWNPEDKDGQISLSPDLLTATYEP